jgi:hypothetical protein
MDKYLKAYWPGGNGVKTQKGRYFRSEFPKKRPSKVVFL